MNGWTNVVVVWLNLCSYVCMLSLSRVQLLFHPFPPTGIFSFFRIKKTGSCTLKLVIYLQKMDGGMFIISLTSPPFFRLFMWHRCDRNMDSISNGNIHFRLYLLAVEILSPLKDFYPPPPLHNMGGVKKRAATKCFTSCWTRDESVSNWLQHKFWITETERGEKKD